MQPVDERFGEFADVRADRMRKAEAGDEDDRALQRLEERDGAQARRRGAQLAVQRYIARLPSRFGMNVTAFP